MISIHAPRVGCDEYGGTNVQSGHYFNPRTPRGVRHRSISVWYTVFSYFNPRTPRGVRLLQRFGCSFAGGISIHAPRVGCDFPSRYSVFSAKYFNPRTPRGVRHNQGNRTFLIFDISIHAPRVGCD